MIPRFRLLLDKHSRPLERCTHDVCNRLFGSAYRRGGKRRRVTNNSKQQESKPPTPAKPSTASKDRLDNFVRNWILPVRFRLPEPVYFHHDHDWALAYRLPLFAALVVLLTRDETSPISFVRIQGPSMIPTMAPDGSEVWLSIKWFTPKRGDIVGYAHPDQPSLVSCKRIIGVAGDEVLRYGQYIDLYSRHDPRNWGISPIDVSRYPWVDWEVDRTDYPDAKLLVPEEHVWLESDCPGFGIDSRQCGPIPMSYLRGRIVARLWPLGGEPTTVRPRPIPLDSGTLQEYNVHRTKDDVVIDE